MQFELIATFPEPLYPFRGPQSVASIEDFRDGQFRSKCSAFRTRIGTDGWGCAGSPATVIDQLLDEGTYGEKRPEPVADRIPKMLRVRQSWTTTQETRWSIDGGGHDAPNLWIVGSSVFSTSATANPTPTIAALTLRTAAAIHRQM